MRIRALIARWRSTRREGALYRRLVNDRQMASLRDLLVFIAQQQSSLAIHRPAVREALFALDWKDAARQLDRDHQDLVLTAMQDHLQTNAESASTGDWAFCLRLAKRFDRPLPVTDPVLARALLAAKRHGTLDSLPKDESDYLLSCYLNVYGEMLERSRDGDREFALPILLEFTAIARLLGPTDYSSTLLQHWMKREQRRPRSLNRFTLDQTFDAPVRGVGSPNGAFVTIYHSPETSAPARMAYAGLTSDRTLNAHMFASLFAAALASTDDRSFLTSVGGVLHLPDETPSNLSSGNANLLRAVASLGGRTEGEAGIPSLGMAPAEALELVTELFQRFHDSTGLVTVRHWEMTDAAALDERVKAALAPGASARRIKSDPRHSEGTGVVHVMPLLHRNAVGEVEPMRIPISYSALNPGVALNLIRTARQSYMVQLIANGRRREAMAKNAFQEQDKHVKRWSGLKPEQQEAACQARPWVMITQSYNFELGIIVPVEPPERVALREFEDVKRPALRKSAKEYADRFASLCRTLEKLNQSGGVADTVAFRLLVDSALRDDDLLIADASFQKTYREWVNHVAVPVWALVHQWAVQRQYPVELLAADNVIFNTRIGDDGTLVFIEPHVMIDLHDFEIVVDSEPGLVYVFPAGRTPTLNECVTANTRQGIVDPRTLHDQFRRWVETRLHVVQARAEHEKNFVNMILNDRRISAMVLLEPAKRLLFEGSTDRAIELFEKARNADEGVVYFWGAVAHQYRHLQKYRQELVGGRELDESARRDRFLNASIQILIDALKPPPSVSAESMAERLSAARLPPELAFAFPSRTGRERLAHLLSVLPVGLAAHLGEDAEKWLAQLRARDPEFIAGLTMEKPDIAALEQRSLRMTPAEQDRARAAMHALAALDLLALAERMKAVARSMPFTGRPTSLLKKDIQEIVDHSRALPFAEPPGAAQIDELPALLGHV